MKLTQKAAARQAQLSDVVLWHSFQNRRSVVSTGPDFYCMGTEANPLLNTDYYASCAAFNRDLETRFIGNSRDFLMIQRKFLRDTASYPGFFLAGSSDSMIREFSYVASELLKLNPSRLTFELTEDAGVFFTFIKEEFVCFLQLYLCPQQDEDQVILSCFEGERKLPSFAGDFDEALERVKSFANPPSIGKSWVPFYELSH